MTQPLERKRPIHPPTYQPTNLMPTILPARLPGHASRASEPHWAHTENRTPCLKPPGQGQPPVPQGRSAFFLLYLPRNTFYLYLSMASLPLWWARCVVVVVVVVVKVRLINKSHLPNHLPATPLSSLTGYEGIGDCGRLLGHSG